jgi:hypothetical protein
MSKRFSIRALLWFDCIAASVAGVAMLSLSGVLAPVFGIRRAVLVAMAIANLCYGSFSFSLAREPQPPQRRVRALIAANFAWTAVCVVLAAASAGPGSWLGAAYILGEGVFVGTLAIVEARAARPAV